MNSLADLHRTVQSTLASNRLGQPVFIRYLMQGLEKPDAVLLRLAQAVLTAGEWLGQPLNRLYAIGSLNTGQVAVTLQFKQGASAQISFARGQPRGGGVDVMVLGNHGALYHDAGTADLWEEPLAALPDRPELAAIKALIERALRSGKPEGKP